MKRFVWELVGWPFGLLAWAYFELVLRTARPRGEDPARGPAIYVNWHRHLPLVMPLHGRHRRWIMMSDSPYMAPIAAWARRCGLRLVRGASGESGRAALSELAEKLRQGESVTLAVDGPHGPVFVAKRGCADLAFETGCPVVAVAYRARGSFTTPGRWDRQRMVLPFGRVTFVYSPPLVPAPGETQETFLARVQAALTGLEER
jgi:lysophospholipid acyltransferase (LPLAT)-like uncharacterized protein